MSKIYVRELKDDRYIIAPDIHFGDEDEVALDLVMKYAVDTKCRNILSPGDVLDFHWLSIFSKNIDAPRVEDELERAARFDKALAKLGINWILKAGNHEKRITKVAPELQKLIRLDLIMRDLGIRSKMLPENHIFHRNGLVIAHGHEKGSGSSNVVSPARYMMQQGHMSVICGHWHKESLHSENRLDGTLMCAWSVGHLQNPHPDYRTHNNWIQGIADVQFSGRKYYMVKLKKIYEGMFLS